MLDGLVKKMGISHLCCVFELVGFVGNDDLERSKRTGNTDRREIDYRGRSGRL